MTDKPLELTTTKILTEEEFLLFQNKEIFCGDPVREVTGRIDRDLQMCLFRWLEVAKARDISPEYITSAFLTAIRSVTVSFAATILVSGHEDFFDDLVPKSFEGAADEARKYRAASDAERSNKD